LRSFLNQIIIGYLARNNLQHLKKNPIQKVTKVVEKKKIKIWPKCSKLPTLPKLKRFGPKSPLGAKIYMTVFNNKGANLGSFWGEKFEFNGSKKNRICCYIFNMSVGLGWF
jgi:hypothetical protein